MNCIKILSVVGFAALLAACAGQDSREVQKLTGSVDNHSFSAPVLGVRVVQGTTVVTTGKVASDGSFALEVPKGSGYRIEVVTRDGVHPLGARGAGTGLRTMAFDVCEAGADYAVGTVHLYDGRGDSDAHGDRPDGEPGDPGEVPPDGDPGCGDPPPDPCSEGGDWCDPCIVYPELCDPCTRDPELCGCTDPTDPDCIPPTDPCLEDPALCDPCIEHPELCEPCPPGVPPEECWPTDPCERDPDLCPPCEEGMEPGPDGTCWPPDPCLEDPALCDPCLYHPEWCEPPPCPEGSDPDMCPPCPEGMEPGPDGTCWPPDPCLEDPAACDPCIDHPEWCEPPPCPEGTDPDLCWPPDPCEEDPTLCECPEGAEPGPDGMCWPPDDPCLTDPERCDPCLADPDSCWPDDPTCPYDDPMCWPEPPECDPGVPGDPGADGDWCWPEDDGCYSDEELPDFGCD